MGVNAFASRYFGEKKIDDTNQVAGQTFLLSLIIGIVFILVTNLFPRTIIKLVVATPDILDLGLTYIRVLGWGMPMLFYSIIQP